VVRTVLCDNCRVLDQQCVVPFVWVGRIMALSSRRLVPGDVVVLQRGKATCDMVLLRGAGLVEESMMSGEASATLF
jgi:P-type E1-E2 ATPase